MPTIIDSLLVKLGLDSSDFDKGRAKVGKGLKETDKGFADVTKTAAKFLAVIGGTAAIKRFVTGTIEGSAALDRFSKNLQKNVEDVSAWSNAVERAGGTAEGLQGTMDMLSKAQTELMLTGQSALIPYFSALGIAIADVHGKARPVDDLLLDLSGRFAGMDRTTANNMGRAMGIDQGTMHLLLKGRAEVELMIKRQKEYGAVSKKQAEEASRMREHMVRMKQEFAAFGRELLSRATPLLEKLFSVFSSMGDWMRNNQEFVETFLIVLAGGLAAVGLAVIPINLTAVAVTALAGAIALLWQDYKTWKRGGDSLIDWAKWKPGIDAATTALTFLKDLLVDILIRSVAAADAIMSLAKGDFSGAKIAAKAFIFGVPGAGLQSGDAAPAAPAASGKPPAGPAARMGALEKKYGLPAGLLDSVWAAESSRGKHMTSSAGAQGHFQFMPATAKQYGLKDPNDFNESADAAARYYRDLIKHYDGDVKKAVAAYNWGMGNVDRKGLGRPPSETRGYMTKVLGGIPGASGAAAGAGANPRVAQAGGDRTVSTHIGEIHIHTAATDAKGIAGDVREYLDSSFTSQANSAFVN